MKAYLARLYLEETEYDAPVLGRVNIGGILAQELVQSIANLSKKSDCGQLRKEGVLPHW